MSVPRYFTLNDRPVKVVDTPDGGLQAYALHMRTGEWVDGSDHLLRYFKHDADTELMDELQFLARVTEIRNRLGLDTGKHPQ